MENAMKKLLLVRQPASSTVMLVKDGKLSRLYQHTHVACEYFARGYSAAKGIEIGGTVYGVPAGDALAYLREFPPAI
jgi:hypothetical protein